MRYLQTFLLHQSPKMAEAVHSMAELHPWGAHLETWTRLTKNSLVVQGQA